MAVCLTIGEWFDYESIMNCPIIGKKYFSIIMEWFSGLLAADGFFVSVTMFTALYSSVLL